MQPEPAPTVRLGDVLRIERRQLVDGVVTTLTAEGRYKGVELVGSSEHIILEDSGDQAVRLFPIASIAEIRLVQTTERPTMGAETPEPAQPRAWDPSFA